MKQLLFFYLFFLVFEKKKEEVSKLVQYPFSTNQFVEQTFAQKDSWVFISTRVPSQTINMLAMINPNQKGKENYDY